MPIGGIEFHRISTNQWVDAGNRVPTDEDGLRIHGVGKDPSGYLTVMYADIPGNSWNQNRLDLFTERANQLLTERTPLSSLPNNHPYKTTDPNDFPWLYWDGGDLCCQPITVSNVTFNSLTNELGFTVSRVR